mmetsp:Transcript_7555/g.18123  ORF Transcript_7555/g.18123 Transcript_7555/m.18123 type:complete len:246 (+) Transcript_7555:412-1149(+)
MRLVKARNLDGSACRCQAVRHCLPGHRRIRWWRLVCHAATRGWAAVLLPVAAGHGRVLLVASLSTRGDVLEWWHLLVVLVVVVTLIVLQRLSTTIAPTSPIAVDRQATACSEKKQHQKRNDPGQPRLCLTGAAVAKLHHMQSNALMCALGKSAGRMPQVTHVETRLSTVAGARDHAHALPTSNLEPVSDLVAAQLAWWTLLHGVLQTQFSRAGNVVVQSCPHLGHHGLGNVVGQVPLAVAIHCVV